jgi:IS30 family transposase
MKTLNDEDKEEIYEILIEYVENPQRIGTAVNKISNIIERKLKNNTQKKSHNTEFFLEEAIKKFNIEKRELIDKKTRTRNLTEVRLWITKKMWKNGYNNRNIAEILNCNPSTITRYINKLKENETYQNIQT